MHGSNSWGVTLAGGGVSIERIKAGKGREERKDSSKNKQQKAGAVLMCRPRARPVVSSSTQHSCTQGQLSPGGGAPRSGRARLWSAEPPCPHGEGTLPLPPPQVSRTKCKPTYVSAHLNMCIHTQTHPRSPARLWTCVRACIFECGILESPVHHAAPQM